MALLCFASQKGAPGVTTTALAVAATWPDSEQRRKLLLEADASGGALALRYQLSLERSLVTLAIAGRAGLDADELWEHVQELPGGLGVIVAPDGADQAHAALETSSRQLGSWLAEQTDLDVIADIGRMTSPSPAMGLVDAADAVLMVARPEAEQLQPAARRLESLAGTCPAVGWVLIGNGPHGWEEVESTYGFPVVAVIADDPRTATSLRGGATSSRITRSPLVRSAASLAETLDGWLHPPAPEQPETEEVVATPPVPPLERVT